jgi:putative phosphotransacetylase
MVIDQALVERVVREVARAIGEKGVEYDPASVVAGVSNRHVHLCREDLDILFGKGYELRKMRDLRQPGQFACEETVTAVTPGGVLGDVRILGPLRKASQFELSASDARKLKITPPLVKSGSREKTPKVTLVGPTGACTLSEGVYLAWRHLHLCPAEAAELGLRDGQEASIEVDGDRGLLFRKVWVRVNPDFVSEFHIDVDEANACGLKSGEKVRVVCP